MSPRGGARPGAGRPRLAHGETTRVELTLGEDEVKTLKGVQVATARGSLQAAIRWLIAEERSQRKHDATEAATETATEAATEAATETAG